jgi:hypothetical protein
MKEETTSPTTEQPITGESEEWGEGFVDSEVFTSAEEAKADAERKEHADREREVQVQMLSMVTGAFCNIVVARLEGADPVSEAESVNLAERVYDLAVYYDIQLSDAWALWLGLIGTAGAIFVPRVMQAKEHAERKTAYEKQGGPDTAGDRTEGVRQDDQATSHPGGGEQALSEPPSVYP